MEKNNQRKSTTGRQTKTQNARSSSNRTNNTSINTKRINTHKKNLKTRSTASHKSSQHKSKQNHSNTRRSVSRTRTNKTIHINRGPQTKRGARKQNTRKSYTKTKRSTIPLPPAGENVRIIPLGGVEEVGRNMTVVEYKDDIIIFDVGFSFEEETTPGIDYALPNTTYLEERKDKIRAVIITHGHLDHIGGLPYIMPLIGNPPIYTRELTSYMILKRQEEFKHLKALDIKLVEPGDKLTFGNLPVEFFNVTHSIPDSMGVSIKTPHGNIVISGDLRLDHIDEKPTKSEKEMWGNIGKENNLLFIADSTNAEQQGWSIPESKIQENLDEIIGGISGRIIVGTFASQFARMIKLIQIAEKYNRKVVTEGRSIKTNIEIAKKAKLLKVKKDTIIDVADIDKYPPSKLFILATGAQGEEFAALMRIATKKHKYISLTPQDTIILSSSVIPGNEMSVQKLKDNLYRHDVHILHYRVSDVHASGHARIEELVWINKQVGAKYFMPAYGYHSMLRAHAQTIAERGIVPKENIIIPDNGNIIDIEKKGFKIQKEKAPSNIVMVDGFSVSEMQDVVLRDRQMLAQDGIIMIVALIDMNTGKLRKSPDLISRGFVYLRESQGLLHDTRNIVRNTVENTLIGMHPIDFDIIKNKLTDDIARFLMQKTAKRPIVIPVLLVV